MPLFDTPLLYVSSNAAAGVASDMQITTSTFTPGSPSRTITATAALSLAGVTQNNVSTSTVVYATRQQTGNAHLLRVMERLVYYG